VDAYNSKLASRIVGVTLRQIQYWDERGFVRPSIKLARGRGTRRLYSFRDLVCLKVAKDLTRYGLSLQKIRRCLRSLKDYSAAAGEPAESLRYVTDGEHLFVITSDREKILRAMEREFVLSLRIGHLVRQLNGEVQRVLPREGRGDLAARRRAEARRSGSA